jgi:sugar phosphate isomerase/epimerase
MKLCIVSDGLGHLSFRDAAKAAGELGIEGFEIGTGNWSPAPHANLKTLLGDKRERSNFLSVLQENGLALAALNCSGNQLHPVEGEGHSEVVYDTVRLAELLGIDTIVLMSGLPAGGPNDVRPNWVTCAWPSENREILDWQWNERLLPYWQKLALYANGCGIKKFCIEMHGNQLVYNVPTLLRLRKEIGPMVGANFDPSHLFWMGANPLAAIDALGDAIHHAHAKDTVFNEAAQNLTGLLETVGHQDVKARSWNYITLGYGHDDQWWRAFCYRLRLNGYDGWLSIEHEDMILSRMEGVRKSVELLKRASMAEASDYGMP